MTGFIMIKIVSFFLIFYVHTISSAVINTTEYDNFTIEWEDFSLFTCAIPTTINISLFTCLPSADYQYVDDMTCLEETTIDFDQDSCQITTTAYMDTSSAASTTQQITTMASTTARMHTSTSITASIASQTSATTRTAITTHSVTTATTRVTSYNNVNTTTTVTITSSNSNRPTTELTTTTTAAMYTCLSEDYIGTYCNISSDACAMSQPCLNAATCFPNKTLQYGYLCQCQPGYLGYNCEYDERACMENTCWHNGTCIPVNSTFALSNGSNFRCECIQGYDGVYCELQIDLCENITCENNGVCFTVELMWKCVCLDSTLYYGDYCQFETGKLILQQILSKSFASIAIGAIITACTFVVIMDILKYVFHIDPVEYERESYRKRIEERRRARQPVKNNELKLALRFQYIS